MTFDAGRIRHDASLMHYSRMSNGSSVPSNWRLASTGDTGVVWSPESTTSVSYGSNSNDVSTSSAPGASSLAARTDHTHRGVRTVSVASNTLVGDLTLLGEGSVGLTVAGQTIKVNVAPVTAGGGSVSYGSNSNQVSYANAPGASSLVSRADHVHLGVTSVSHASNTFSGPVILTTEGNLGITSPTPGTYAFKAVTGGGGSGGGGLTSIWTKVINEDGSSVANWTARDGTWGTSGGVIQQTNTGAAEFHLQYTAALVPLTIFVVQAELWIPSANATDDYIGMDLGMNTTNTNNSGIRVYLKRSGTSLIVGTNQGGSETGSPTVTVNTDTWYTVKVLVAGSRMSAWLDGSLKFTRDGVPPVLADNSYFGLFTALSTGQFRNIQLWTLDLPI